MLSLKSRGRAASTRNHYVQHFRDVFRWAVKKGYLDRSPISPESDIRQEKPAKRERRLTEDEDRKLLEAGEKSPRLYRLIMAALETGCRAGELLKLQWRDVHLDRRELVIRASNAKNARHRILPISARLASVLEMGQTDPSGQPFGPDAYVFGNEVGHRIKSPQTAWENALTRAGITGPQVSRSPARGRLAVHRGGLAGAPGAGNARPRRSEADEHVSQRDARGVEGVDARPGRGPRLQDRCKFTRRHPTASSQRRGQRLGQVVGELAVKCGAGDGDRTRDLRLGKP